MNLRSQTMIRELRKGDCAAIAAQERLQGWHASAEKYECRLADAAAGKCVSLVAELDGAPVGYVNVYWAPEYGPFAGKGIPEIVDFGVLERCRNRGIGSMLMDHAEELAGERSSTISLAVGIHSGYGAAQRLYIRRGYIFDGSGAWYKGEILPPYAPCVNDDDLVLYMSKAIF
ncbi:MAG: GNAT family N-acetyltransferase [Clostridia bacterium]|nr:GNAT family N-acetyltransferase [Clostridia bacterium]